MVINVDGLLFFHQVLGSVLLLASACSGSSLGHAVSSQFHAHDGAGGYSYGYTDPNSQKHESKDAHGVAHGEYSYVDANGKVQTVKYVADPIHGFQATGTNLPNGGEAAPAHGDAYYETPEVKAAKAAHFAAHANAKSRLYKRHVPADTPEVAAAKAAHLAVHAAAGSDAHWDHHAPQEKAWHGPLHHPVIEKGVPVETPEVKHAKAAHAAAHAKVDKHDHHYDSHDVKSEMAWHGPQHVPVIKNGVPVETPEVQKAKAAILSALATADSHSGHHHGHEDDGSYKPSLYEH